MIARGASLPPREGPCGVSPGSDDSVPSPELALAELEAALEIGGVGTWRHDLLSGAASWDARMRLLHGLPPGMAPGAAIWEALIHPEDAAAVQAAFRDALRGGGEFRAEYRLRADGRWLRVVARGEYLGGRATAFRGIALDVTRRRRMQEALERSEARLRRVQEIGRVGGFEIDLRTGENQRSAEYMAVQGHPAVARTEGHRDWVARLHPEDRARAERHFLDCVRDSAPVRDYAQDYRVLTPGGEARWIAARAVIERDAKGRALRMQGAHLDITELRAARDALADSEARYRALAESRAAELERARAEVRQGERLAALGQLTGGVAHDFVNWLQVMMSGLALLEREGLEPAQREQVMDGMHQAAQAAQEVCGRLLAFARRQPLAPEAFDLRGRLLGMAELLRRSLGNGIALALDVPADLPPAFADPGPLEAAVMNLVVNARDAMPGGGTLTLRAWAAEGRVFLAVADTGAGMSEEVRARACEPFFTTKPEGVGTGLGLAQVFGFAQQSGGAVTIESAPGQGTTVTIALPAGQAAK